MYTCPMYSFIGTFHVKIFFFELRLAGYLEFLCLNFFVLLASRSVHLTTLFRSGCGLYHSFGHFHLPVVVSRLTLVYPITV